MQTIERYDMKENLPWWEREKLLTAKDKEAIQRAIHARWTEISEDWAETELGREELHHIILRKYHQEEEMAGIL